MISTDFDLPNAFLGGFGLNEESKESRVQKQLQKFERKNPEKFKIIKPFLNEDKGNPERLIRFLDIRSVRGAHKVSEREKTEVFMKVLESECHNIHDVAILVGLFGQVAYLKAALDIYPDLMESKYSNHLKAAVGGEKLAYDFTSNPTIEDTFGEIDIFISLESLGVDKSKVSLINCFDRELSTIAFSELSNTKSVSVLFVFGKKYTFSYLVISSIHRIYIFDLSQMNAPINEDVSLEKIRYQKIDEFKSLLLKLLANNKVVKYLANGHELKKLLKEGLQFSYSDREASANFVDRRLTFLKYLKMKKSEEENQMDYNAIKKQIDDQYYQFVEDIFSRPFNREAEVSNWDARPPTKYQTHYLALSAYILLLAYQKLDSISFQYDRYETFRTYQKELVEKTMKSVLLQNKQKITNFASKLKSKLFG